MTEKTDRKADETVAQGGMKGVLFVVAAIVAIVGLFFLAQIRLEDKGPKELPLVSIQLEYDAMTPDVRAHIVTLERQLGAAESPFDVFGPTEQKYLVPGATAGAVPQIRTFEAITEDDWEKAFSYFTVGDWLVPRVFRIDGKACVLRLAPKDGARRFRPDAAALIQQAVENARGNGAIKAAKVYSSALGLGGQPERDALNVTFGATTAWVKISRGADARDSAIVWPSLDGMKLLAKVKPAFSHNAHIRSTTTPLGWLKYFEAVRALSTNEPAIPADVAVIQRAFTFAHANQIQAHLDQNGDEALVAVTSDLEGKDNLELYFYLASVLQEETHVKVKGPAWKLPNGPAPAASPTKAP